MTEPTKFLLIAPNMADEMFLQNILPNVAYFVCNDTITVEQVISLVPQADNLDLAIAFKPVHNKLPLFSTDSDSFFSQKFVDMLNALKAKSATFNVTFLTPRKIPSDAIEALQMPTKVVSTRVSGRTELSADQALYLSKHTPEPKKAITPAVAPADALAPKTTFTSGDAAPLIRSGEEVIKGIKYSNSKKTFYLTDDITWQFNLATDTWLELEEGETFDGRHHQISSQFDGTDANNGLFKIGPVTDPNKKPLIKHLTVKSRVTSSNGGIVRQNNTNFHVHECVFKGSVEVYGGGICGYDCYEFVIDECKVSGIIGEYAGGICGYECSNSEINKCSVDGIIERYGGGICGLACGDMKISKCKVNGTIGREAGGICGMGSGSITISNCIIDGSIEIYGGGVCGYNCDDMNISKCQVNATIGQYAGGICGYQCKNMNISNCVVDGSIANSGGGICGYDCIDMNISKCRVNATIGRYAGGIIGNGCYYSEDPDKSFIVDQCYSTGSIEQHGGGIAGFNCTEIMITNCYSTGIINSYAGGISGDACYNLYIKNCYSSGEISMYAGGIAAYNTFSDTGYKFVFTIEECYSLGKINAYAGGLVGYNTKCHRYSPMHILNSYSAGRICSFAGGIIGYDCSYINVENTYAAGSIAYGAAGIAYNSSDITMTNCYDKLPVGNELNIALIHHDKLDVLPTDIWKADDSYPMLRSFRRSPWDNYNEYDDKAKH